MAAVLASASMSPEQRDPASPGERSKVEAVAAKLREAQALASALGVKNLFQPGIAKEMVIADVLGHVLIPAKREADAKDEDGNVYEYLSALRGGTFQIDRLYEANLYRITRNAAIFCATFSPDEALRIEEIHRVETDTFLREARRQLKASKNAISHVGVSAAWVRKNGTRVFPR